jgi:hypothetical protein
MVAATSRTPAARRIDVIRLGGYGRRRCRHGRRMDHEEPTGRLISWLPSMHCQRLAGPPRRLCFSSSGWRSRSGRPGLLGARGTVSSVIHLQLDLFSGLRWLPLPGRRSRCAGVLILGRRCRAPLQSAVAERRCRAALQSAVAERRCGAPVRGRSRRSVRRLIGVNPLPQAAPRLVPERFRRRTTLRYL